MFMLAVLGFVLLAESGHGGLFETVGLLLIVATMLAAALPDRR